MLSYSSKGSITHSSLIFLHGFLGCKEDWDEVISHLENDFHCLSLNLPGHGSTFSEDFFEALSHTRATLIGYSMGGRIALTHRSPFSRVIAISAHPGLVSEEERKKRLEEDEKTAEKICVSFEQFLEEWYAQPLFGSLKKKETLFQEVIKRRLKQDPRALAEALRQFSLGHQPSVSLTPEIFFMCGEEDLKYRELYRKLIPEKQVRLVKDCGHALYLEDPKQCADIIRELLC
jgi:2-succinyl-6-hydroxy-2,4-cyclohexadiene-1-carboxylate synthase